jgi:hypothetical protein
MEVDEQSIEKSSEVIDEVRSKLRDELKRSQALHRISAFDTNRFLESEILNENDIKHLSARIKRRKRADEEDLIKLGNAFFQSDENITAFMKITGAINVLIKEFIAHDKVNLAAKCLCNLALGNDVNCVKIAKSTGIYLVMRFKNFSDHSLVVSRPKTKFILN